jgi:hypothetical protein
VSISFPLNSTTLGLVDAEGNRSLFPGTFGVEITNGVHARVATQVTVDVPSPVQLSAFKKFW